MEEDDDRHGEIILGALGPGLEAGCWRRVSLRHQPEAASRVRPPLRSESNLVTLDRGEPDVELFAVDGLREGPPSSLIDRPEPCDAACAEAFRRRIEKQDQLYFALRATHAK